MSIDPINEAFIAASSLQASDDIHKSFRKTFDLSQCTKVIPDTLTLLVRSLSDEVEARFEKSFAQRDAELLRLRADVIALKNEAALTLASAKKYVENVDRKFENFIESIAFQTAVDHQITVAFTTKETIDHLLTERLKRFLDSIEFEKAVEQVLNTLLEGELDVSSTAKIRTLICDILQRTAFVVPTS